MDCKINVKHEYENEASAKAVTDRFGIPDDSIKSPYQPSIGIPTFEFGNEPPNRFSTRVGKLFRYRHYELLLNGSKAIRQDMLVEVAKGGVLVCPGSSGTRQEIFQFSCNCYDHPEAASPLVFFQVQRNRKVLIVNYRRTFGRKMESMMFMLM